jgi:type II secretory pathway pseudopilin PulG
MDHSSTSSNAQPVAIPKSEEGYVLLIAIFFVALLVLSLAVAAPQVAKSIQRDRDLETFHRGMQYRRAVQLYYRSFHAYPPNIDALVKTNNIRFLRKRYIDPITGKDDWKPIMFGQNKTPTAMGFFGQPLSGNASTIAGTGPGGGNSSAGTATSSGSAFGGGSFGGSSFGGSNSFGGGSSGGNSIFGGSDSGSGQASASGTSSSTAGSTGGSSSGTGSSGSSSSGTDTGLTGQTFGGAGIIGFEPASLRQSILVYKKKNHYNEWEFTYDPLSEMPTVSGGNTGTIGQPASSTSSPVGSPSSSTPAGQGPNVMNPPSMPPDNSAP